MKIFSKINATKYETYENSKGRFSHESAASTEIMLAKFIEERGIKDGELIQVNDVFINMRSGTTHCFDVSDQYFVNGHSFVNKIQRLVLYFEKNRIKVVGRINSGDKKKIVYQGSERIPAIVSI